MLRPIVFPSSSLESLEDAVDNTQTHGSTSIVEILESTMENMDL